MAQNLFCFGLGFSALATVQRLQAKGWQVAGTVRTEEKAERLRKLGIEVFVLNEEARIGRLLQRLAQASHILQSVPLIDRDGDPDWYDPIYDRLKGWIADARPQWFGYLSTTVVYGDHQGGWVDEETPVAPTGRRGQRRVAAEQQWTNTGLPNHIFRLAGIYGPGRNALETLLRAERTGKGRPRIFKEGQVFSRIHVEDIASTLIASMENPVAKPFAPEVYNVCDDEPSPPQDVIAFAAELLNREPPPLVDYETAELSPMARSFYSDNKRVSNAKIKKALGVEFAFPTYRESLPELARQIAENAA